MEHLPDRQSPNKRNRSFCPCTFLDLDAWHSKSWCQCLYCVCQENHQKDQERNVPSVATFGFIFFLWTTSGAGSPGAVATGAFSSLSSLARFLISVVLPTLPRWWLVNDQVRWYSGAREGDMSIHAFRKNSWELTVADKHQLHLEYRYSFFEHYFQVIERVNRTPIDFFAKRRNHVK